VGRRHEDSRIGERSGARWGSEVRGHHEDGVQVYAAIARGHWWSAGGRSDARRRGATKEQGGSVLDELGFETHAAACGLGTDCVPRIQRHSETQWASRTTGESESSDSGLDIAVDRSPAV
jgi:hypothetical protein